MKGMSAHKKQLCFFLNAFIVVDAMVPQLISFSYGNKDKIINNSNNATVEYKTTMNIMDIIIKISKLALRIDGRLPLQFLKNGIIELLSMTMY